VSRFCKGSFYKWVDPAFEKFKTDALNGDLTLDIAECCTGHFRRVLVILELLFKLVPLEGAQLLGRDLLTVEGELQHLADVGRNQGIDLLLGSAFAAERCDRTMMSFLKVLDLVRCATPPLASQFGTLRRQSWRGGDIGRD
jgi:hypothetical protein